MHEVSLSWSSRGLCGTFQNTCNNTSKAIASMDYLPYNPSSSFINSNKPRYDIPTSVSALLSLKTLNINDNDDGVRDRVRPLLPSPEHQNTLILKERRYSDDSLPYPSGSSSALEVLTCLTLATTPAPNKKRVTQSPLAHLLHDLTSFLLK
ncbi:hypothetical protein K7432_010479 [Basidiobolus ranarum]|uniref:Uncharacterized protein n=1 Tax=Basidiobolus ranarum TaxID=34480 RepID=A0ABR2VVE4_9FUNG